ncbi:hypothetical protein [Bacillus subtilis]|uniref:hypothetical protein n=1 Tax=Bacillus subtilis TaxID=1423 RepID=UPI00059E83FA|nr:hypothetical protein [Bacillus subtilis]KIN42396.1 hypothetical protein B4070_4268 [Bacillus subtilis]
MKEIYRFYKDTEVLKFVTNIKCPYCGAEWQEEDVDKCGETFVLECEDCEKKFKMHFDAN